MFLNFSTSILFLAVNTNFLCLSAEVASSSEAFQEIEGETEERRRARLNHHMRTQARMVCGFSCLPFAAFSFFCFFNGEKKKRKRNWGCSFDQSSFIGVHCYMIVFLQRK